MSWRRSLPFLTLALTLPAVIALGAPAPAAAQQRGPYFELFGSYLRRQSFDEQALGGRAGYRFSEHWAMEANLSRLDLPDSLWFEDVSAKYYFWDTGRTQLFALGGGGFFRNPGDDETTAHLGLGAEVGLSPRLYLRPEARARWFTDDFSFDPILDYSLGIGFRF